MTYILVNLQLQDILKNLRNVTNNPFERKGNKIYLTTAGEKVYHALKNSQQYRNLDFEIGQLHHNFSGEFKLGASSTISQYVIPKNYCILSQTISTDSNLPFKRKFV